MSVVASPIVVFGHNWVTEFCYSTCYNQQHSTSTTLLSFVQHCKTIQAGSEARTPIDTEALLHASQGNQRSPFSGTCWALLLVLNSKVLLYVHGCVTWQILCLQLAESSGSSTVVVKIVKISPATAPCRSPESQHTVSIFDSSGEAKISFSAVYQPCNLLERPKVNQLVHPLVPHMLLCNAFLFVVCFVFEPHFGC